MVTRKQQEQWNFWRRHIYLMCFYFRFFVSLYDGKNAKFHKAATIWHCCQHTHTHTRYMAMCRISNVSLWNCIDYGAELNGAVGWIRFGELFRNGKLESINERHWNASEYSIKGDAIYFVNARTFHDIKANLVENNINRLSMHHFGNRFPFCI